MLAKSVTIRDPSFTLTPTTSLAITPDIRIIYISPTTNVIVIEPLMNRRKTLLCDLVTFAII